MLEVGRLKSKYLLITGWSPRWAVETVCMMHCGMIDFGMVLEIINFHGSATGWRGQVEMMFF